MDTILLLCDRVETLSGETVFSMYGVHLVSLQLSRCQSIDNFLLISIRIM
jgi:hypothetical protein